MSFKLPNYYSVIPANVRYCPELTFFEIVLYSEISALSNALGFCYASNSYFSKLYQKDVRTISRAIKKLSDLSFIKTEIEAENGNLRKIYLTELPIPNEKNYRSAIDKNVQTPIDKNVQTSIDKNVQNNTTSSNTTSLFNSNTRASDEEPEQQNINDLFLKVYKKKENR